MQSQSKLFPLFILFVIVCILFGLIATAQRANAETYCNGSVVIKYVSIDYGVFVNVRAEPNATSTIEGVLEGTGPIPIVGESNGWLRTCGWGWINGAYTIAVTPQPSPTRLPTWTPTPGPSPSPLPPSTPASGPWPPPLQCPYFRWCVPRAIY